MRGMLSAIGQAQCATWATVKHSTEHQAQVCQAFPSCCVMNPPRQSAAAADTSYLPSSRHGSSTGWL